LLLKLQLNVVSNHSRGIIQGDQISNPLPYYQYIVLNRIKAYH